MGCSQIYGEISKLLIALSCYKIISGLLVGWVLALFVGELFSDFTRRIQDNLTKDIKSPQKNTLTEEIRNRWNAVVNIGDSLISPNRWLGRFEVTFFYICLFSRPEGIGAWLVFKVAVKWESWANIVKIPNKIKSGEKEIDDLEFLELRNKLATVVSQKFMIGTLGNILAAIVGFGLFCIIRE